MQANASKCEAQTGNTRTNTVQESANVPISFKEKTAKLGSNCGLVNTVNELYLEKIDQAIEIHDLVKACDPDVACDAIEILHRQLSGGAPIPSLDETIDEAQFWATDARSHELAAYAKASINTGRIAKDERKRLFMALWNSFTAIDRHAFIAKHASGVAA